MKQKKRQGTMIKLGIVAILAGVLGGFLGIAMESRPFKQKDSSAHLVKEKITGLFPGSLKRPINILVLGIDNSGHQPRDKFNPAYSFIGNSDTMLLVHISNKEGIKILSIPRDTQVRLPGVGIAKINAANIRGGVPLAVATVSQLLKGVKIDRYVRVNTQGLIQLVDAVGGIEINVPKAMKYTDETQHLYINFLPGKQVLNGQKLQEYLRFRDRVGDIGRVQRQQEVLQVLTRKLVQPITLLKIPQIYAVAREYLDTDLSIGEIVGCVSLASKNTQQPLQTILLPGEPSGSKYRLSYWLADDQKISQISRDFGTSENSKAWSIAVANGTKQPGLATKTVTFLKNKGFSGAYVFRYQGKSSSINFTQILVPEGEQEKAQSLKEVLGRGEIKIAQKAQITLLLGQDWTLTEH